MADEEVEIMIKRPSRIGSISSFFFLFHVSNLRGGVIEVLLG